MKNPFPSPPDSMASAPGESSTPSLPASPDSSPWADAAEPTRVLAGEDNLAGEGNAFARRLLESAREDGIPAAPLERLARALNMPAPLPLAVPLAAGRGSLGWVYTASLVGLAAFGVLSIGERVRSEADRTPLVPISAPPDIETSSSPAVSNSEPSPRAPRVTEAAAALASSHASAPRPREARSREAWPRETRRTQPQTKRDTRAASTDAMPTAHATSTVTEELRALEAAQLALRAGRSGDAQRALDDYARRFPRAELALEAELLRVDVSLARGERTLAVERARALGARPGAARYRERLDALLKDAATDR